MVQRTVPILVRVARSGVDGRPIRTTCGTDHQVVRTCVDWAYISVDLKMYNVLAFSKCNILEINVSQH